MSERKYVGVRQIAEQYGVANGTIRGWAKKGLIPYLRIGDGNIMFNMEDVEREMKKHIREVPAQEPATPADKDM